MPNPTCSVDGCDRKHLAKGMCKKHYYAGRRYAEATVAAECANCGESFQRPRRKVMQIYCSTRCAALVNRNLNRTKWPTCPIYVHPCYECGEIFAARRPDHLLCSDGCRRTSRRSARRLCLDCGVTIPPFARRCHTCREENAKKWRASYRAKRKRTSSDRDSGKNHRARAEKYGARYEPRLTWKRLMKEDGPACYLCGFDVDPDDFTTVAGRDGRKATVVGLEYPTVDHVVALANGGHHERSNVRLSHQYCNAFKRDLAEV